MSIFYKERPRRNDPNFTSCKRCGRTMLASNGDYGPRCARILAGQVQLDSMLISGKVLRKKHPDIGKLLVERGAITPAQLKEIETLPEEVDRAAASTE